MIDLYTWKTPNGRKVTIMLEEAALAYAVHRVDLRRQAQAAPAFRALSPLGKIPAIIDHAGADGQPVTLFESGAILIYLAEKTGMLLAREATGRARTLSWLMVQMSALGPMLGEMEYFDRSAPERSGPAADHFAAKAGRVLGAIEGQLETSPYLAGEAYSIADIACYPWLRGLSSYGVSPQPYGNINRWLATIGARPAVRRGMAIPG